LHNSTKKSFFTTQLHTSRFSAQQLDNAHDKTARHTALVNNLQMFKINQKCTDLLWNDSEM